MVAVLSLKNIEKQNTLSASWRQHTLNNYWKYINLCKDFASVSSFELFSNRVQNVLDFLSKLFCTGRSHSQICAASSALYSIITIDKLCQEISYTWDIILYHHMVWHVRKVCNYFRNFPVMIGLTLKKLSLKLGMLLCLIFGGQGMQTIHIINLKDIRYVGVQISKKQNKVKKEIIFFL